MLSAITSRRSRPFAIRFVLYLFLAFFSFNPYAVASSFDFCVMSDDGPASVKVFGDDNLSEEAARIEASEHICSTSCVTYCAAEVFSDDECGQLPVRNLDLNEAQSKTFCEYQDGTSARETRLKAKLDVTSAQKLNLSAGNLASLIGTMNGFLTKSACPVEFALGKSNTLTPGYDQVDLSTDQQMASLFRYPGTIKLVTAMKSCNTQLRTNSIDGVGDDHIEECASREFNSFAVPYQNVNTTAVLVLRGLSHLANIKDSTLESDAVTIADPTMLIPDSPVLTGDFTKFRVRDFQCAKLMRYLRDR